MTEEEKEMSNIIDRAISQYYDVEAISNVAELSYLSMSSHNLRQTRLRRYKHVKLIHTNYFGDTQVHFVTEDGHYLLLPWCYIVSMIPSIPPKQADTSIVERGDEIKKQ